MSSTRTHFGGSQESGFTRAKRDQDLERVGEKLAGCDVLERMARIADPTTCVWRGSEVTTARQGMKVLGTPLGHQDLVRPHLEGTTADHQLLLGRIPLLGDLESSWLLLVHCAVARANCIEGG